MKMNAIKSFTLISSFAWFSVISSGCTPIMRLTIETETSTNAGQPFTVVVQKTDSNALPTNDHREVFESLFSKTPNSPVLSQAVVLPGQKTFLEITIPNEDDIIVYFLFTRPGEDWWWRSTGAVPDEVTIFLKKHEIDDVVTDGR